MKPLILVLKKFLHDRSLLLSYSGGLSSYALRYSSFFSCLLISFNVHSLMVARFLQEQKESMDTGSLLLGFLHFFGNIFDPRITGLSVAKRCYFNRQVLFFLFFLFFLFLFFLVSLHGSLHAHVDNDYVSTIRFFPFSRHS